MEESLEVRHCPKCDTTKPITEFWKHKRNKSGYHCYCKVCHKKTYDNWRTNIPENYAAIKERTRERMRERYKNDAVYREERKKAAKDQKAKDPEAFRKKRRRQAALKTYGITAKQYDALYAASDSRCYICDKSEMDAGRHLSIDHCHATGKVRGILCDKCNAGLGMFSDSPAVMTRAIEYLRRAEESAGQPQEATQYDPMPFVA